MDRMERHRVGDVDVHLAAHGAGRPVLVLHGAGVDHREPEACFEPALAAQGGLRRIYRTCPATAAPPHRRGCAARTTCWT